MASSDSTTKQCSKCGEYKPATTKYFRLKRGRLIARCRECERADHRQWLADHIEESRAYARNYVATHREHHRAYNREFYREYPEVVKDRSRRYAQRHPERVAERHKRYHLAHPTKRKEMWKRWAVQNHDRVMAKNRRRRARERNAPGSHTAAEIAVLRRTQPNCWWCGKPIRDGKYHIEHRVPLSRGGSDDISNLVISCPDCNQSKYNKLPSEWNGRLL